MPPPDGPWPPNPLATPYVPNLFTMFPPRTTTSPTQSTNNNNNHHLSGGAIFGIVLASLFATAILLSLSIFIYLVCLMMLNSKNGRGWCGTQNATVAHRRAQGRIWASVAPGDLPVIKHWWEFTEQDWELFGGWPKGVDGVGGSDENKDRDVEAGLQIESGSVSASTFESNASTIVEQNLESKDGKIVDVKVEGES